LAEVVVTGQIFKFSKISKIKIFYFFLKKFQEDMSDHTVNPFKCSGIISSQQARWESPFGQN